MSNIQTAIIKGLNWLDSQQNPNGSWASDYYPLATTCLAVLKFESYALETGYSPFDDNFVFKNNVVNGLNYIFLNAQQDVNGVFFEENGKINYETGLALAAICGNAQPTRLVNVVGSIVNGKTFKEVAQLIVNYLAWSQQDTGVNRGGWAYEKGDTPDNSVSGYPTLGLEFAISPSYRFECIIPNTLLQNLNNWITFIQDTSGGSGYQFASEWVNILKTGNLIQQMHLFGDDLSSTRLQKAITYIANNWNEPVCLTTCAGWNANPADYQATFTTMKGLSSYGIQEITPTVGAPIDWYASMSSVILAQQNADGSWPQSQWDSSDRVLSTTWALLTLEKTVPSPSKIPFKNYITVTEPQDITCPWDLSQTIEVQNELKIFAHKYKHSEAECSANPVLPGKGDDIGFTLVFGNYGESTYVAPNGIPTVEDTLYINSPVNLKLMSICECEDFILYNLTDDKPVRPCDFFYGGIVYNLQVRKYNPETEEYDIFDFDIPCHSIYCISMLFQIDFPACPSCPDDVNP